MPTVLRATDSHRVTANVAFNFDDLADQAKKYLDQVRVEAGKIVVKAQQEAAALRARAQADGRQAALDEVDRMIQKQLATVIPALRKAILDIHQAKQAWLAQWEASAVHLAAEIAKRLIRGELTRQPQIPQTLIREALQMAVTQSVPGGEVRLLLNPDDHKALAGQVKLLVDEMAGLGETQIVADATISPGGCRVETRFGAIDQTFEAQTSAAWKRSCGHDRWDDRTTRPRHDDGCHGQRGPNSRHDDFGSRLSRAGRLDRRNPTRFPATRRVSAVGRSNRLPQ